MSDGRDGLRATGDEGWVIRCASPASKRSARQLPRGQAQALVRGQAPSRWWPSACASANANAGGSAGACWDASESEAEKPRPISGMVAPGTATGQRDPFPPQPSQARQEMRAWVGVAAERRGGEGEGETRIVLQGAEGNGWMGGWMGGCLSVCRLEPPPLRASAICSCISGKASRCYRIVVSGA